jgi:cysteine desulfurase
MMQGYFDYNATTPTRPEVIEAMSQAMAEPLGNPSSMHAHGRRARHHLDQAREQLALLIGAKPRQIVFTSGATESNNMAMRGFAAEVADAAIVTTNIEHVSVLATADALAAQGTTRWTLPVDAQARPDFTELSRMTGSRPCLVTTAWANGETGHIADLDSLTAAIAENSLLLMDAAQAVGRIPTRLGDGVDMISLSAHKFGGPRGIGALALADDHIASINTGGPQERNLRPGTENLPGIVGMGVAAELRRHEMEAEASRLEPLRERIWERLGGAMSDIIRISPSDGLPNTLTIAVGDVGADVMLAGLDLAGFSVSAGSACAAGAPEPSHVAIGLGVEERYVRGVIRISSGWDTTEADADALIEAFTQVISRARQAA